MKGSRSILAARFALLLCYLSASTESHGGPPADETPDHTDLAFELIYKKPVHCPPDMPVPIRNGHLVGHGRILLESKDLQLFMCSVDDGSILWRRPVRELYSYSDDLKYTQKSIRAARYEESGTLGLVIMGSANAEYVQYVRNPERIQRFDLSDLMKANYADIRRVPRHNWMILGVNGLSYEQSLHLIDLRTRKPVLRLDPKPAKHNITSLAFSDDGRYAAATGDSVYVWDLSTGRRLNDVYQPPRPIIKEWLRKSAGYRPTACAFSSDGELLAVATGMGRLLVFDVLTAKLLVLLDPPEEHYWGLVQYLTFLGDTRYILGPGGRIRVYDFARRAWLIIKEFEADEDMLSVGAVSVDDNSIFVCDYVGNLRRYDWTVKKE